MLHRPPRAVHEPGIVRHRTPEAMRKLMASARHELLITNSYVIPDKEDIELFRIQDIDFTQRLTERMVDIGDIVLHTGDESNPNPTLRNVSDPDEVHELLRRAMLDARKRNRVGFREEI